MGLVARAERAAGLALLLASVDHLQEAAWRQLASALWSLAHPSPMQPVLSMPTWADVEERLGHIVSKAEDLLSAGADGIKEQAPRVYRFVKSEVQAAKKDIQAAMPAIPWPWIGLGVGVIAAGAGLYYLSR